MAADNISPDFLMKEYGSTALLLEWPAAINKQTLHHVMAMDHKIAKAKIKGITETVMAYHSLVVYFNASTLKIESLKNEIITLARLEVKLERKSNHWDIPVCYDREFALDHLRLEQHCAMDFQSIVKAHQESIYDVYCIGFLPGFTYMGKVVEHLQAPRLDSPRITVPKGSVGIAGPQTGIYTTNSPGGWNIIGRTHFEFFDPNVNPPCRLQPGDTASFHSIEKIEFDKKNQTK